MNTQPIQPTPQPLAVAMARKFTQMGAHVYFTPRGMKACKEPAWEQKATNNTDEAVLIAQRDPFANIMLVGKQDGVWGLDDDAGLVSEYEKSHGAIQTYGTRTVSGGRHFIFRQNAESWAMGNVSVQDEQKRELLSARINNRYVIGAGSWAYPNNDQSQPLTQYTAIDSSAPIVEAPQSLLEFIKAKEAEWKSKKPNTSTSDAVTHVHEGGRNNYLIGIGGKLRNARASYDSILLELTRINETECVPPLPNEEVESVARSAANYKEGTPGVSLTMKPATAAAPPIEITPELLAKEFPSYDGSVPAELPMLVQGFIPKGVGFFGSPAGTVKTWLGLSVTKALTTATPLWGVYEVREKVAVLYLVPEASDASFKIRLSKMRIIQDPTLFRFRTISQGKTRPLTDPLVMAMIKELQAGGTRQVLVIVDTAVRFFSGKDENSSMDNSLVEDSDNLRGLGADILFLHHSPKSMKDAPEMTTENVLRGTGDFGAMADYVYGFRRDEGKYMNGEGAEEVEAVCTKPRDISPQPLPFRLQLKRLPVKGEPPVPVSVIDETGDLRHISNVLLKDEQTKAFLRAVKADPYTSLKNLTALLKLRKDGVKALAKALGWRQIKHETTNAKGETVSKFRWTNSIPMGGQAAWAYEEPSGEGEPDSGKQAA